MNLRGRSLREMAMKLQCDHLLEPMAVAIVESGKVLAVDVEDGNNFSVAPYRHYDFATRCRAACYVSGELLHIGYHEGAVLLPCRATHTFSKGDVHTCHRALEGAKH